MTTNNQPNNFRVGELNSSQLLYSFGVGAIVDLPQISVIVSGLDDWTQDPNHVREIKEDRLLIGLKAAVGPHIRKMYSLPATPDSSGNPFDQEALIGVPVSTFPNWMVCPACRRLASLTTGVFELRPDMYRPDRTKYVHANCSVAKTKPPVALPARFLVTCEKGHLDDFPWIDFVHYFGQKPCTGSPSLTLEEYGPSGEARDLFVFCQTCENRRQMAEAFGKDNREKLPDCSARRPHLHDFDSDGCKLKMRPILLGASNLWFSQVLSAISIPDAVDKLSLLVNDHWGMLNDIDSLDGLKYAQKRGDLKAFVGFSLEEILTAIKNKRESSVADEEPEGNPDLLLPEWMAFSSGDEKLRSTEFQIKKVSSPGKFKSLISKVVLVERLREVKALAGFTRIDSPSELDDGDEQRIDAAPLSRSKVNWLPAVEVRGEGIFIEFSEAKIQNWLSTPAVLEQERIFLNSHIAWRTARNFSNPSANFPGMRYILLHTFSHALMRQIVLECGYTQASIRERIYSRSPNTEGGPMAGILLYTSAPDSEGTLGGLVNLGNPEMLEYHIQTALEEATLCASDPTCSEHRPEYGTSLHAAACHACLFAPETSCEKGNRYLDRAVLVNTISSGDSAFFA